MEDLSKIPTQDLMAFKEGRLSDVSTESLMAMRELNVPSPNGETTSPVPQEPLFDRRNATFMERMGESYKARTGTMENAAKAYVGGEQSMAETALQQGLEYAQLAPDVAAEAMVSGFRALPDFIENPIRSGAKNVYSTIESSPAGELVGDVSSYASSKYKDLSEEHPRSARNIGAVLDAGNLLAAFIPIKGGSSVARGAAAVKGTTKAIGGAGVNTARGASRVGVLGVKLLDEATDAVAGGASNLINRADIPKEMRGMSDPEILFLKTLKDEGVSADDALQSLKLSQKQKAVPSVAVTANIPQMQTQAYLTSRGSAGSKVAAEAIKDIDEAQIPRLNKSIIEKATGGKQLGAEEYGKVVATEAKKLVDNKIIKLRTRAKPYYVRSVGVDKSVPIQNEAMKMVLGNPLARQALDDFRTDAFTLTNAAKELSDLGVDAGNISKLPYNSTVSLHSARVHLRQLNDAAFRAGEKTKSKAIKQAISDIDAAIESAFPDYKTARGIYSEDAGALRVLKDSPVGRMSEFAEGDYSKISNDLMKKDASYIRKFSNTIGKNQKMKDSIAGAFLQRQLEDAAYEGRRFSDKVFKNKSNSDRLTALVGKERFDQMKKIDSVIDDLLRTRTIPAQSITAAAQSIKGGVDMPTDKEGLLNMVRRKIAPSLFEMVQRDPKSAARYNELLFTEEGYKLLDQISTKTKFANPKEMNAVASFLNDAGKAGGYLSTSMKNKTYKGR